MHGREAVPLSKGAPMKPAEYLKILDRLTVLLRRKPMTARAIAEAMHCSRPVAHDRLAALRLRGERLLEVSASQRSTGPKAVAYWIPT